MTHTDTALRLQRCTACGAHWSLRPYACAACGAADLEWVQASGRGVVKAVSQVARAPDAWWAARAPYILALVSLEEGATLMGHAEGDLVIGQAVQASLRMFDDRPIWVFGPAAGA